MASYKETIQTRAADGFRLLFFSVSMYPALLGDLEQLTTPVDQIFLL